VWSMTTGRGMISQVGVMMVAVMAAPGISAHCHRRHIAGCRRVSQVEGVR